MAAHLLNPISLTTPRRPILLLTIEPRRSNHLITPHSRNRAMHVRRRRRHRHRLSPMDLLDSPILDSNCPMYR